MSPPAARRWFGIRSRAKRTTRTSPRRFTATDAIAFLAAALLVISEFSFPLAEVDFGSRYVQPAVNLQLLSALAEDSLERYSAEHEKFVQRTMGKQTEAVVLAVDAYKLLSLQLKYLRYFSAATPILMDEAAHFKLLYSAPLAVKSEDETSPLRAAVRSLASVQLQLDQCLRTALDRRTALERVLSGPHTQDTVAPLYIATLNALPDLLRGKNAEWLKCQEQLSQFDIAMHVLNSAYPAAIEELSALSEKQKHLKTFLRWTCTAVLCYCAAVYRRRWIKVASETFGG